jgi:hypothetical protein
MVGSGITVPLTSCLSGLESAVWQLTIFVFICKTDYSKQVKQEVNCTVILPPSLFPGWLVGKGGLFEPKIYPWVHFDEKFKYHSILHCSKLILKIEISTRPGSKPQCSVRSEHSLLSFLKWQHSFWSNCHRFVELKFFAWVWNSYICIYIYVYIYMYIYI